MGPVRSRELEMSAQHIRLQEMTSDDEDHLQSDAASQGTDGDTAELEHGAMYAANSNKGKVNFSL